MKLAIGIDLTYLFLLDIVGARYGKVCRALGYFDFNGIIFLKNNCLCLIAI